MDQANLCSSLKEWFYLASVQFPLHVTCIELHTIAHIFLTYGFWRGLLWNLTPRGDHEISPRYARRIEKNPFIMQFIHSILCTSVYIYILYRIMNSKSFLQITHTSFPSTLNVVFLKAFSLVTCFLKILMFTYTWVFHLHVNVLQFPSWLQLCLSNCFWNDPCTTHPAKSIPF